MCVSYKLGVSWKVSRLTDLGCFILVVIESTLDEKMKNELLLWTDTEGTILRFVATFCDDFRLAMTFVTTVYLSGPLASLPTLPP